MLEPGIDRDELEVTAEEPRAAGGDPGVVMAISDDGCRMLVQVEAVTCIPLADGFAIGLLALELDGRGRWCEFLTGCALTVAFADQDDGLMRPAV